LTPNILIYAHDADAGIKRQRAVEKLRQLWENGSGRLSVQVLQEFYVNVTRKLTTRVARSTAREVVNTYSAWVREPITPETVLRATDLAGIGAALVLGCVDRRRGGAGGGPLNC